MVTVELSNTAVETIVTVFAESSTVYCVVSISSVPSRNTSTISTVLVVVRV